MSPSDVTPTPLASLRARAVALWRHKHVSEYERPLSYAIAGEPCPYWADECAMLQLSDFDSLLALAEKAEAMEAENARLRDSLKRTAQGLAKHGLGTFWCLFSCGHATQDEPAMQAHYREAHADLLAKFQAALALPAPSPVKTEEKP